MQSATRPLDILRPPARTNMRRMVDSPASSACVLHLRAGEFLPLSGARGYAVALRRGRFMLHALEPSSVQVLDAPVPCSGWRQHWRRARRCWGGG
jgi:hypothetical protein